jgi:hypothetical protein
LGRLQLTRIPCQFKSDQMEAEPMSDEPLPNSEIILYHTEDGRTRVQCRFENETVWLTQAQIAELFETTPQNVTLHLKGIFAEGELRPEATIRFYRIVRTEGKREVARVRWMCRPFRAWNPLGDGTQGIARGCRLMPRWGGRNEQMQRSRARRRRPTKKGDLMIRSGGGGRATCKGCLQVLMERNQKP